jgi:hypothetical protein
MKRDLLTILCMTLVCASLMLGIMGVYRIVSAHSRGGITNGGVEPSAFRISFLDSKM